MAKKKVAAIVKIQIPAGKATPAPPVGTALGPHGVGIMDFVKQYNAATESQVGTIIPVEITDLRGPHVHVHPQDAADAGAAAPEGRPRQGLDRRRARPSSAPSPRPTSKKSPRSRCPTSTPTTSKLPSSRSAAPPARWASRSADRLPFTHRTPLDRDRPRPAALHTEGDRQCQARSSPTRSKKFDRDQLFTPTEALELVKTLATAKFDESVDVAIRLGVDPRKADQMVRGTVALPSGTGKDVRVAVFAAGEAAQEARDAGADIVGADDLAAAIEKGKMDFDVAIATPDMMPLVGRLGRVLGPAWPDAQPEDRHRHPGRRPRRRRVQGRQGRVPHRPLRQRARAARQGQLRADRAGGATSAPCSTSCSGPSRHPPRAATSRRSRCRRRWAPASRSTPTACAPRSDTQITGHDIPAKPPVALPHNQIVARQRPLVPPGIMGSPTSRGELRDRVIRHPCLSLLAVFAAKRAPE